MSPRADLTDASDQELVAWARQGREEAYGELLRRYQPSVLAFIYRIVCDHGLAEDLTQETFVKAFNALDSQRPESKFEAWIFRIANHVAVDYLRRKRLDTLSLDTGPIPPRPGESRRRRSR